MSRSGNSDGTIVIRHIPVDISPERLAGASDLTEPEAASFLETALGLLAPSGVFREVSPMLIFNEEPAIDISDWGPTAIIGLCALGSGMDAALRSPQNGREHLEALARLALCDALSFLEYRVRHYLKPTGRKPGLRLVPGCRGLSIPANKIILDRFGPEYADGLKVLPSGEIDGPAGVVFVYPTSDQAASDGADCRNCLRRNCPARAVLDLK
jgi:hypothetical protein